MHMVNFKVIVVTVWYHARRQNVKINTFLFKYIIWSPVLYRPVFMILVIYLVVPGKRCISFDVSNLHYRRCKSGVIFILFYLFICLFYFYFYLFIYLFIFFQKHLHHGSFQMLGTQICQAYFVYSEGEKSFKN